MSRKNKNKNKNIDRKFPNSLLKKSDEKKLEYFRDYEVKHPILEEIYNKVSRLLKDLRPGSLILVYGSSGVGKTTLIIYLEKMIKNMLVKQLEHDKEMIPLVKVEAESPENGNFNWGTLYREMLNKLSAPANGEDVAFKTMFQSYAAFADKTKTPVNKLRYVLRRAIKRRHPKAVIIDEAQHFTILSSGRKLDNQPNVIKSFANQTKTTHILFGCYDLLPLRDLNGQLARRSENIHFRRYDNNIREDVRDFKNILWLFQNHLPLKETPDLVSEWKYIYTRTTGCVGLLKDWLYMGLSQALSEKSNTLEIRHLEETKKTTKQTLRLVDELLDGEGVLYEDLDKNKEDELEEKIWGNGPIKVIKNNGTIKEYRSKPKKRTVGERKPKRDPIGRRKSA